jgi:hypothetical protein
MRPDPHHPTAHDDTDRIIYIGDVRRRRQGKRRAPDRHYLAAVAAVSVAAWAIWVVVLLTLAPSRLLTYLAFFVPLGLALAATSALAIYGAEWRSGRLPSLTDSIRRGILVALLIVANLALQASHHWSIPGAGISILAAIVAEAVAERRAG